MKRENPGDVALAIIGFVFLLVLIAMVAIYFVS